MNNYNKNNKEDKLPPGSFGAGIPLKKIKKYLFRALPGPDAVRTGRIEHEPLHFHVQEKGGREYRVRVDDFTEISGYNLPSDLRKLLKDNSLRKYLRKQTESIFETGRLKKGLKPVI